MVAIGGWEQKKRMESILFEFGQWFLSCNCGVGDIHSETCIDSLREERRMRAIYALWSSISSFSLLFFWGEGWDLCTLISIIFKTPKAYCMSFFVAITTLCFFVSCSWISRKYWKIQCMKLITILHTTCFALHSMENLTSILW